MRERPIIAVENFSVVRGGVTILDGINWRVQRGEHWVVLGANGSGKTSLLRAITGYLTPSGGTLQLLGRRYGAADWMALRKRIGIVSSAIHQMMADREPA